MAELSQSQSKTLFSDFIESRRGEFCDSQSSTDTYVPSEGQVLLRRCQSEGVCLACSFCVQCCEATPSVPLRVTAGVFVQPLSPCLRRRWLHSHGSNRSLDRLLSVGAKFAVTKTEALLQVQSLQLLESRPVVYDRQLLLSSCQETCCK